MDLPFRFAPVARPARARGTVAAILVLLLGLLPWRACLAQQWPTPRFVMTAPTVEVPFTYVRHQILVPGAVDGHANLALLFDTGAAVPVMDASLDLHGSTRRNPVLNVGGVGIGARHTAIESLSVGVAGASVGAQGIAAVSTDLSPIGKALGRRVDGIVGLSFCAGFIVEVDYARRRLRFTSAESREVVERRPDNRTTFLMDVAPSSASLGPATLAVRGTLGSNYDYPFVLDTGFGGYVSVPRSDALLSGLLRDETPRVRVESPTLGRTVAGEKIRASLLMIGPINLSNRIVQVDARAGDAEIRSGIIGNRMLQNYRIALDVGRRKLWIERVTRAEEPDEAARGTLGMTVRVDGDAIEVAAVADASPAARAGIRPGDVIVRMDGLTIEAITVATAISVLASPDGPTDLVVRRGQTGGPEVAVRIVPAPVLDWQH